MLLGGIICWWPPRRKRPITLSELKAVPVPDPVGAMVVSSGGETLVSPSVDIIDLPNENKGGKT